MDDYLKKPENINEFYDYAFAYLGNQNGTERNIYTDCFLKTNDTNAKYMDEECKEYLFHPEKSKTIRKWYKEFTAYIESEDGIKEIEAEKKYYTEG